MVEHCGMGEVDAINIFFAFDDKHHYFHRNQHYNHHHQESMYHQHRHFQMESVLRKAQTDQTAILETEVTQSYVWTRS